MFKVQFKDGEWQDDMEYLSIQAAEKRMSLGIKDDGSGPWRIVNEKGEVVKYWPE